MVYKYTLLPSLSVCAACTSSAYSSSVKYLLDVSCTKQKSLAFSMNFSSEIMPYLMNRPMLANFSSNAARSALNNSANLSATFFVMYELIFFTFESACKNERDTFNGISGESITPCNNIKNSGTMSFTSSVMNTCRLYN